MISGTVTSPLEFPMTIHTTTLTITGMSCGSCVHHVDQALRAVAGVSSVTVDRTAQLARVLHNDQTTSEALIAATVEAGYDAVLMP